MRIILKTSFLLLVVISFSCKNNFTPKPRGYFRIDFPDKNYQLFDSTCPFSFEYPTYGEIVNKGNTNNPCWMDIRFDDYQASIHLSYKEVHNNLISYLEDSRTLAYKHTIKADAINENVFYEPERRVFGIFYEIEGNAASSVQFFLTDSLAHFVRGSLYFNVQPNQDSLAPAISFFKQDVIHLMQTFRWK